MQEKEKKIRTRPLSLSSSPGHRLPQMPLLLLGRGPLLLLPIQTSWRSFRKWLNLTQADYLLEKQRKFDSPFQSEGSALPENFGIEIGKRVRDDFRKDVSSNPILLQSSSFFFLFISTSHIFIKSNNETLSPLQIPFPCWDRL